MLNVRPHAHAPDQPQPGSGPAARPTPPNRLNLLFSYAGWRTESWADVAPLILEPLGVRSLQASTGQEASQIIKENPIHIAVVDLGLPLHAGDDTASAPEAGPKLLDILRRLDQPPPTIIVKRARSHREDCREINAALRSGAFAVIDRPHTQSDLERLLEVLRRCLSRHYQGRWPGGAI